jgi:hypothetical protein
MIPILVSFHNEALLSDACFPAVLHHLYYLAFHTGSAKLMRLGVHYGVTLTVTGVNGDER